MDNRKLAVLRAIVEDYVATNEPVGSKSLADRHALGVSSATIRNDMAALEEEGLISAPHTSAGRIPTDAGYRVFVDKLSTVKPLSSPERKAIQSFLDDAVDLDDVMNRSVRLLAQLTKQVALVQYPSLGRSAVRHIELVPLGQAKLMLVMIADTGRVEQRVVDVASPLTEDFVSELRQKLNALLDGQSFAGVADRISNLAYEFSPQNRSVVAAVIAVLMETVVDQAEERVVIGGTSNIARMGDQFVPTMGPLLEALEEHVVLMRLFNESLNPDEVSVRIGHEHDIEEFQTTSFVTVGYGSADQSIAQVAVVGPTRMDYGTNMGTVRAVARYIGQFLTEQQNG